MAKTSGIAAVKRSNTSSVAAVDGGDAAVVDKSLAPPLPDSPLPDSALVDSALVEPAAPAMTPREIAELNAALQTRCDVITGAIETLLVKRKESLAAYEADINDLRRQRNELAAQMR